MNAAEPSINATARNPGLDANVMEIYPAIKPAKNAGRNALREQIRGYEKAIAKTSTRLQHTATNAPAACAVAYNGSSTGCHAQAKNPGCRRRRGHPRGHLDAARGARLPVHDMPQWQSRAGVVSPRFFRPGAERHRNARNGRPEAAGRAAAGRSGRARDHGYGDARHIDRAGGDPCGRLRLHFEAVREG